ncbi:toxin-antitoxin system YwqK family antitoxin [Rossellomorea marisflavi]|uniref:toxin-antitoxin system YwqK family antitoxin n=1 Tax=Rossellomorea marisflavi TaxID=189381 RepID=UPI001EE2DC3B|nr:hypothetical protein [Rossellomorea marisflavi]UKS66421.1 hypothetical protein K6T23_06095 [Rossellomorea marisflavi]
MEELLTKEYVLKHGVEFETQLEYGGPYGQGIVIVDEDGEEHLFTGLVYDLHSNGELESYFYVSGGVKEGRYVEFYPSGAVASIRTMHKSASHGHQLEFYENGRVREEFESVAGKRITFRTYDENGNVLKEKTEWTEEDRRFAEKWGRK